MEQSAITATLWLARIEDLPLTCLHMEFTESLALSHDMWEENQ